MNKSLRNIASLSLSLVAGATLALAAGGAHAQANTGSLAGWTALGDASAASGAITLTTAFLDGGSDQAGNVSGTSAVDYLALTAALSQPADALDVPFEEATEGSLVMQTFNMLAGQQLSFTWSYTTVETLFSDRAFVSINGTLSTLATLLAPGAPSNVLSFTAASSGPVTLAVGVVDTGDYLGVSRLTIGNLQVSAVPEPASLAMLLAGLSLVGAAAARRRAS